LSSLLHLEHFEHRRKNLHAASILSNRSESAAAAQNVCCNVVPNKKEENPSSPMITEYTTASVELALSLANMFCFVLATCLLTSHSFCSFSGCESSRETFTKREFCKTDYKQADQESYHPPPPPPCPPPTVTTLVLSPNKKNLETAQIMHEDEGKFEKFPSPSPPQ
jgi:hypothetical protein